MPQKLGDPVAAQNRDGDVEVFWISDNNTRELYQVKFKIDVAGKKPPKLLPGPPTSLGGKWSPNRRPVITQNAANELELFMVGLDGMLYHMSQKIVVDAKPTVQWSSDWVLLKAGTFQAYICGDPVVARNADGRLEVFVLSGNLPTWDPKAKFQLGHLYQYQDNGILKWSPLWPVGKLQDTGFKVWSPRKRPAVGLNPDGLLEVFMVGLDGMLYHTWQTEQNVKMPVGASGPSAKWLVDWYPFGTRKWQRGSNPSIACNQDWRIELFLGDSDGKYYHRWQTSKNGNGTWDWSEWEVMP